MKKLIVLQFLLQLYCFASGQQQQFDIVSYNVPKGFVAEQNIERLTLTKDGGTNGFCIITIFKSIDAGIDSQKNFDISWDELVKNIIPVNAPAMQPPVLEHGWKTEVGSSVFEKDGIKGTVILLSSTKNSKLVNIQVLLNGDDHVKDMAAFLETVSMTEAAGHPGIQSSTGAESKKEDGKKAKDVMVTGPKADVWVYLKSSSTTSPIGNRTVDGSFNPNYFIVYPNGDYYPRFPLNGLHELDNNDKKDGSWGRFTLKGNKGVFQSKYDRMEVEKISATLMKRNGYTFQLRKMASVDGLLLEGEWGPYPDWEKQAHLSPNGFQGTGVRNVISFKKDGSFNDNGFFVTNLSFPKQDAIRAPGKGTYSIKNFTLLLKYDDGRLVYKAFTGAGSINPAQDDKALYINENPCYKTGFTKTK